MILWLITDLSSRMVGFCLQEHAPPLSFAQATFTAINIESGEDSEEEVDDTREIQVMLSLPIDWLLRTDVFRSKRR